LVRQVGDCSHRFGLPGVSRGVDAFVVELVDAVLLDGLSPGDRLVGIRQPEAHADLCSAGAITNTSAASVASDPTAARRWSAVIGSLVITSSFTARA
jgi:hypothetical protein